MGESVLVTGGAGFIGRHVAGALLARGDRVRVLDSLIAQVHPTRTRPDELDPDVELLIGDIRDEAMVGRALEGVDSVIHLAAEVGVGQSMYAVDRYTSVNDHGTAVLFQRLIDRPVRRAVVASSMSIYGEGLYRTADGTPMEDVVRGARNPDGSWDPLDSDGRPLIPVPTPESKRPALRSVYAIGKYVQERLTLTLTAQYGMEGAALRLWNVYGPGQALSNPYTGVLAIFASRIANGQRPMIFEDGRQRRDFVHVGDVARAFLLALDQPAANGEVFNIGSGEDRTVEEVARLQAASMGRPDLTPEITGQARAGDIRHNIPDLGKARTVLNYEPRQDFAGGLAELAEWVARQEAQDRVAEARSELEARGLVV
ncbi:NAD-dependent epimerase/dehydratase family protein [Azospirillum argentinense]|uniref:NAD-dependent epimerase/dehydratase domain-containing protein n=1 Tax=Azospirillum argentinense TaxID=2970906 RepID=A0A5B0KRC8_9PROT|nr:NAD-dependent epimerase/dehydratase family protein [Azospirillum argentinense]KAA1054243.1 UDP-glucose 4-epimerase [Azospirillum argentinense]